MTIKDIAKLANTSRGTVDRVIHKRGKVNKDLTDRILAIIDEYGYEPNVAARSLSLSTENKKVKIGVLVGSINHAFFSSIIEGIKSGKEKYLGAESELILKEVSLFDYKAIESSLNEFKDEKVNLIILSVILNEELLKKVNEIDIPIIALNIDLNSENKICFIGCDYENSGKLAANVANLILKNESRISLVIGSLTHAGQVERLNGFKKIINPTYKIVSIVENYDNDEVSYKKTKEILEDNQLDLIYFLGAGIDGGLKAIKESNRKDIKVLTVDQTEYTINSLKDGSVTASIVQHPYTQGLKSIEYAYVYLIKNKAIPEKKIIENSIYLKESIIPHQFKEEF